MSEASIPAFFSASMMARACSAFLLSAPAAVADWVWTPKWNEPRSGVAYTVPFPVTVLLVLEGVADRPRRGCATPPLAAATRSTPARKRTFRSLFMRHIRRRGAERHQI